MRNKDGFIARPVQIIAESPARASIRAELSPDSQVADRGVVALLGELAATDKD